MSNQGKQTKPDGGASASTAMLGGMVVEDCDCCQGAGLLPEVGGGESGCFNCCGSGKLKYDGLALLRDAVIARRECHKAYSEFTAAIAGKFPTREERDKEVALRSALGMAERAVMDAAESMTANVKCGA